MTSKKIKVLIVDDSSTIRTILARVLSEDPGIHVVGAAPDPYVARDIIANDKPDVMILDIEMPRMDGLTFLEKVMAHMPIRTIVFSSLTQRNSALALRALEIGAVDVMMKPTIDIKSGLGALRQELTGRIRGIAAAHFQPRAAAPRTGPLRDVNRPPRAALEQTTHQVLAIASSTGGTEALKALLPELPHDIPGTVVVQHMPPVFSKTFADSLQRICPFEVKEAEDGDRVLPGRVLIAPGNFHMELTRSGAYYFVKLNQEPLMHGVRPAADILMRTVAKYAGANSIGVVLTGMGRDGAEGLLAMKNAGSFNIAQDEATCVVFGMPKVAIDAGAIHQILPLNRISTALREQFKMRDVVTSVPRASGGK